MPTPTSSTKRVRARRATTSPTSEPPLPPAEQVRAFTACRSGKIKHAEMARRLGLRPEIVRQAYKRGGLPGAVEHSAYILMVPLHLLRLAEAYGLRQVERMAKAGLLTAN